MSDEENDSKSSDSITVLSVNEISQVIKSAIDKNLFNIYTVSGELSNFKIFNNVMYASLKDNSASIGLMSWNYKNHSIELKNGDQVTVTGKFTYYVKNGNINMMVNKIVKTGMGALFEKYNKIKLEYQNKGAFDNKRSLPVHIRNIGIATSVEGAVIRDMMFVLKKNNFKGNIIIKNCNVQGATCPNTVRDALDELNKWKSKKKHLDVIIVARGGGSFDDLIGFSNPIVLDAILDSKIPIISAIGHETDFMLSDFVADCRAPTPSIAAEMIIKSQIGIENELNNMEHLLEKIKDAMLTEIKEEKHVVKNTIAVSPHDYIQSKINELNCYQVKIHNHIKLNLEHERNALNEMKNKIKHFDIKDHLNKGFCLIIKDNKILTDLSESINECTIMTALGEYDVIIKQHNKNK
jgi:exodeoxyribonuclease VII large subunit